MKTDFEIRKETEEAIAEFKRIWGDKTSLDGDELDLGYYALQEKRQEG